MKKYDFLLGPVAPTTALKMGEGLSDPLAMYLGDIYTVMINIAGLPSLALPCEALIKTICLSVYAAYWQTI